MKSLLGALAAGTALLLVSPAHAQFQPAPAPPPGYGTPAPYPQPYGTQPQPYGTQPYGTQPYGTQPYGAPYPAQTSRTRTPLEMGFLYATSVIYGVGIGVWIGAEAGIDDPATFMIAPTVLGLAAPIGVFALDHPLLPRGVPAAIAAGAAIGAGEGIGIASYQFVSADDDDAWGFRGLSRATAIGATVGAAGGAAVGFLQKPSPRLSLLLSSGAVWGASVGSMIGYGASEEGVGYGVANDSASLGGLIGYNAGLALTGALSAAHVPSYTSLGWMWGGGAIGFLVSLPIYLTYAKEDGPPAKRGLIFSGAATTLGIVAGGIFTSRMGSQSGQRSSTPAFARVTGVAPLAVPGAAGLSFAGELY